MVKIKIPVRAPGSLSEQGAAEAVRDRGEGSSQDCIDCAPCLEAQALAQHSPEQEDLLVDVLSIADNLERALSADGEELPIREGVALTHRGVMHILRKHGLERLEAEQQPFDPRVHEAIGVVSAARQGVEPGTVVEVLSSGYRRGTQLFRPARVVVAQ
jgi:molecular chaperone GrpE